MFTGIIEETGTVKLNKDGRLEIECSFADEVSIGQSVAVNGVCLTLVAVDGDVLRFEMVRETLERSNLGGMKEGYEVNLERTVQVNGQFDGHIVQGHVDCVGTVNEVHENLEGDAVKSVDVFIVVPEDMLKYVVEKGSVTVDGISLTVTGVGDDWFSVSVIPHTMKVTNLHTKEVGCSLNIEVDVMAKYVEKMIQ
jgi:riboflavin synthase